jgi:hypothetical protein
MRKFWNFIYWTSLIDLILVLPLLIIGILSLKPAIDSLIAGVNPAATFFVSISLAFAFISIIAVLLFPFAIIIVLIGRKGYQKIPSMKKWKIALAVSGLLCVAPVPLAQLMCRDSGNGCVGLGILFSPLVLIGFPIILLSAIIIFRKELGALEVQTNAEITAS